MKRIISLFLLFVFISSQNIIPAFAHEGIPRNVIADTELRKGSAKVDIKLIRIAPGKVAAVMSSKAEIQKVYLKSPSGKQFKAGPIKSVPVKELGQYIDHAFIGGKFRKLCKNMMSFIDTEAYASCGSCGGGGGSGGHEGGTGGSGAGYGQFVGLLSMAGRDLGQDVEVAVIEVVEEEGEWEIFITVLVDGMRQRLRGNFVFRNIMAAAVAAARSLNPRLREHQRDYERYARRLREVDPESYEAQTLRRIMGDLERDIRREGGEVPTTPAQPQPAAAIIPPAPAAPVPPAPGRPLPSASSYDPETGVTVTSQGNADGSRTVTTTAADGTVTSVENKPAPGESHPSVSATEPSTGQTTTITEDNIGTRTTVTDRDGNVVRDTYLF